jgi:hypothetical protein
VKKGTPLYTRAMEIYIQEGWDYYYKEGWNYFSSRT